MPITEQKVREIFLEEFQKREKPSLSKDEVRGIVMQFLSSFVKSDRYTFEKLIQMLDGRNIQLGRGTGTMIATDIDQKLGFHGVDPTVQGAAITSPTGGATIDAEARAAIDAIITFLQDKGLTA